MENSTSPLMPEQSTEPKSLSKKGKKKEITFPFLVKKGSVSVKIYSTPSHGCDSFTLSYYQDGVRKRPTFPTFKKAKEEAEAVAGRLASTDADVLTLTSADRAAYLRARQLLDPLGISIEMVAAQYAEAMKHLGDVPLMTAVEFFRKRNPVKLQPKSVQAVVDELIEVKKADGASERYLQCLRWALGKFNNAFHVNISAVAGADIDAWLRKSGLSPRTRNNLRNSVQTLFSFAKSRRYVTKDHDELEMVPLLKDRDGDIEVFTAAELVEILNQADERLIPFLTVGAFAGIRHAEIQRLDWRDVRFDDGIIEIGAAKAKTASRRTVPITDNLRAWLLPHRQAEGPVCSHRNMAFELHQLVKRVNKARKEKQVKEEFTWKHNALRHSFISYRVANIQNLAQVSLEAGNSPQMIFRHYRELVTAKEAARWFSIKPGEDGKIIFLEPAKGAVNPDAERPAAEAQALPAAVAAGDRQ